MCLIVVKPKGSKLNESLIPEWYQRNPHGAGLMYLQNDKRVRILKGAMNVTQIYQYLDIARKQTGKSLTDINLVLHLRFATDGSVNPSNCHPFPVTHDEKIMASTHVIADVGLAHNGVISDLSTYRRTTKKTKLADDKTDTQRFIEKYLVEMKHQEYRSLGVRKLIRVYTNSKFAIMDSKGILTIGDFIKDEGCLYSNTGYKPYRPEPIRTYTPATVSDNWNKWYQKSVKCVVCGQEDEEDSMFDYIDGQKICEGCYERIASATL